MDTVVVCEFCEQPIAKINREKLKLPLTAEQFESIDALHGIPDPFHPEAGWINWKCPFCRLRPFYDEEHLTFQQKNGKLKGCDLTYLKKKFKCKKCGKEVKHQSSLSRHEKKCNG